MTGVSRQVALLGMLLFSISAFGFSDEINNSVKQRILLLCIGGGLALPSYGSKLNTDLDVIAAGNQRINVYVDLCAGLAISDLVYVLLKANGFATRIDSKSGTWSSLDLIVAGASIRYYPNIAGSIFFEIGGGTAETVLAGSGWTSTDSKHGFGGTATIGLSYTRDRRGLYVSLVVSLLYSLLQGDSMYGIGAFVSLNWEP
jgi:hypothetical protein